MSYRQAVSRLPLLHDRYPDRASQARRKCQRRQFGKRLNKLSLDSLQQQKPRPRAVHHDDHQQIFLMGKRNVIVKCHCILNLMSKPTTPTKDGEISKLVVKPFGVHSLGLTLSARVKAVL
jgi:hypothetical protein